MQNSQRVEKQIDDIINLVDTLIADTKKFTNNDKENFRDLLNSLILNATGENINGLLTQYRNEVNNIVKRKIGF